MDKYLRFVEPKTKSVVLNHNDGWSATGTATTFDGREAVEMAIPAEAQNGHGAHVVVTHEDYELTEDGVLWLDRKNPVTHSVGFDVDGSWLKSFKPRALPRLVARGQFFGKENGERFTAIEASDFNLLARFAAGDDVRPVLSQRQACGFNMLRVWTLMHLAQWGIGDLDPCPYDKVADFCALCARYGLYVEFTAYTSTFDTGHWDRLADAVRGLTNVILELVNENDQSANTIDTNAYHSHDWVPCSHGSNGSQQHPVRPWWHYETFHTNGASEEQRKIGHNAMECSAGAEGLEASGVPTITNETSRYPDVGMWVNASLERQEALAYDSAAGAALLNAGSCFHSVHGKASQLWDDSEAAVARAWAAGARSVPLEFQDGSYLHRSDLEAAGVLRAYERRLGDGRGHVVLIRA